MMPTAVAAGAGVSSADHCSERALNVLTLSIEYPNAYHRGLGLFIRSRLQHIGAEANLKVISPVTLLDYSSPGRKWLPGGIPKSRVDGNVQVLHPRWMYPPFGTPLNVVCLFVVAALTMFRLRRTFPCDIIDAHFGYPDGVAAALLARLLRIPFIITLRGNEPIFAESPGRRWCLKWAFRQAACVIGVSERLRRFAVELGAEPSRTRAIGNGVDAAVFQERDSRVCRQRHGIPEHAKVILTVGSLLEAKGHHHVIAALDGLVRRGVDGYLVIAGSETRGGPGFEHKLREAVAAAGLQSRVKFTGWIPPETLAELMSAADVLCLASDAEGWPNVVHEASSCGLPVVATDVGSVPDLLPSDRYGMIVRPGDRAGIEEALATALSREWDRHAIALWGQSRSWTHVAREVLGVMQQVIHVRN